MCLFLDLFLTERSSTWIRVFAIQLNLARESSSCVPYLHSLAFVGWKGKKRKQQDEVEEDEMLKRFPIANQCASLTIPLDSKFLKKTSMPTKEREKSRTSQSLRNVNKTKTEKSFKKRSETQNKRKEWEREKAKERNTRIRFPLDIARCSPTKSTTRKTSLESETHVVFCFFRVCLFVNFYFKFFFSVRSVVIRQVMSKRSQSCVGLQGI